MNMAGLVQAMNSVSDVPSIAAHPPTNCGAIVAAEPMMMMPTTTPAISIRLMRPRAQRIPTTAMAIVANATGMVPVVMACAIC